MAGSVCEMKIAMPFTFMSVSAKYALYICGIFHLTSLDDAALNPRTFQFN